MENSINDDGSRIFVFTTGSATGGWRSIALIGRLGRDNSLLGQGT